MKTPKCSSSPSSPHKGSSIGNLLTRSISLSFLHSCTLIGLIYNGAVYHRPQAVIYLLFFFLSSGKTLIYGALFHLLRPSTHTRTLRHWDLLLVEQCNLTILNYSQIGRSASMATRLPLIRTAAKAAVTTTESHESWTCLNMWWSEPKSKGRGYSHPHTESQPVWRLIYEKISAVICFSQGATRQPSEWKEKQQQTQCQVTVVFYQSK